MIADFHPDGPTDPIGDRGGVDPNPIGVNWGESGSGPAVLISSRDGHPVPRVPGAERLADRARAAGWGARLTYALADVPAAAYADPKRGGETKKPAHLLHTVAVRLARGGSRAYAVWARVDDGSWRFDGAGIDYRSVTTLRDLAKMIEEAT